ncbi:hypothetical protein ACFL4T_10535 [candidate division KSB1 bacterium]
MKKSELIQLENRNIKFVKFLADLTCSRLYQENLTIDEAFDLLYITKRQILKIFPDKDETYDLIYKRRFLRIIEERFS